MPQERRSSSNAAFQPHRPPRPEIGGRNGPLPCRVAQAKAELGVLAAENDIFAAHLEMADDPMLAEQVEERISEHGFRPDGLWTEL
ncbi:MAG: phosphoenolpyruvate-utilizing N-terminal domain-containing protein [Alistipes finegoldii]